MAKISVSLPDRVLEQIDGQRGLATRSAYIVSRLMLVGDDRRLAADGEGKGQDRPEGNARRSGNGPREDHVAEGQSSGADGATPSIPAARRRVDRDAQPSELPKIAPRR